MKRAGRERAEGNLGGVWMEGWVGDRDGVA